MPVGAFGSVLRTGARPLTCSDVLSSSGGVEPVTGRQLAVARPNQASLETATVTISANGKEHSTVLGKLPIAAQRPDLDSNQGPTP